MLDRRRFLAAGTLLLGAHFAGMGMPAASAEESNVPVYRVDLDELVKAFPRGAGDPPPSLPTLLRRFGEWLAGKPWRSVGAFDLAVEWSDMHFPGGERFFDQFALFMRLPDGSAIGSWLAGHHLADAPIVLLGSEGAFETLAPNLAALLARIALGDFSDSGPASDLLYSEYGEHEVPDLRGSLQAFLRKETGVQDLASLAGKPVPDPSAFAEWVEASTAAYEAEMRAHPAIVGMGAILEPYRPVNGKPWESTMINVRWVGEHFEAWIAPTASSLPEAERVKQDLGALRDAAALGTPGLGLWHRATLMVRNDALTFLPDYIYEPDFRSIRPPAEAFKADQLRAPRAAGRIPPWLAAILAS